MNSVSNEIDEWLLIRIWTVRRFTRASKNVKLIMWFSVKLHNSIHVWNCVPLPRALENDCASQ